ncbi:MAG: nitrile hydratase subunit alpha [Nitriliruptorales bacterium]|nr:nitrile hydratase subunit alpha [Nitriliruptorales bacterium]
MRELLVERGVVDDDVDRQIGADASRSWQQGARLVSRAWVDPAYRQRLLTDAKAAARELDVDADAIKEFVVLENTEEVHHLVVCTLCSCYPRAVLGDPPAWYKSEAYRSRAVREPAAVLAEFGWEPPEQMRIVVVDSSADRRFMVLPRRPRGSEGMSEADLRGLVTRNSLIGVGEPRPVADA